MQAQGKSNGLIWPSVIASVVGTVIMGFLVMAGPVSAGVLPF